MSPLSPGCTSGTLGTEDSQTCCKSVNLGIFTASPVLQSEVSTHRVMGQVRGKHLPWATWPHHSPRLVCDELGKLGASTSSTTKALSHVPLSPSGLLCLLSVKGLHSFTL